MDNSLNVKALILAGGKGTRLAELTKNLIPKPMVVINGKTILERAVMQLKRYGVTDIFMSVGFLNEKIRDHFGNGEKFGVKIEYIVENEPLGSGGALFFVKDKIKSDLIVCPGDVIFDVNFNKLVEYHRQKNALITLFSHPNIHPYDSDLVMTDNEMRVTEINKKNSERNFFYKNLVNAGIFVLSPETLSFFKELKAVNMEHDFVASFIESGRVFAYKSSEYVKDVGTMDRFSAAEKDLNSGDA